MKKTILNYIFLLLSISIFPKSGDTPMPVELIYFEGQAQENKILLLWGTATEINNYGFFIQRTTDFSSWTEVDFVMGHGTSYVVNHYSFVDSPMTVSGTYHYRLKQMDTDGMYKYTDTIAISIVSTMFELIYFEGTAQENSIRLTWATASEMNNLGFVIERTIDFSSWTTLTFVIGQGNSNITNSYSFVDSPITVSGTYHYRLKQISFDSSYSYSYIVPVEFYSSMFELIYFEGTAQLNSILLRWATASEMDNQGFYIQRSDDNSVWTEIGFVAGQGNSSITNHYTFIDTPITLQGTYGYRLRQVDYYGNSIYSYVVSVPFVPTVFEFVYFEGSAQENSIRLLWAATNEINSWGFYVQRSEDSSLWNEIGFVEGHGTSFDTNYYAFIDTPITSSGTYNYRLKQIDFDGAYRYSNIVPVEIEVTSIDDDVLAINRFSLFQNYPNPFNPVTTIKFSVPSNVKPTQAAGRREISNIKLIIYDMLGREVAVLVNERKQPGTYEVEWNASGLSSGIYYYLLKSEDFIETKSMIYLK
ncbi:MAG TPA: T9SS type A sorting domain-containing protein [Ignavibacteriaceae bacterium]|nr:T9SS type A sorting domain-containing protein [Ignavibacteriaceae bacterium]